MSSSATIDRRRGAGIALAALLVAAVAGPLPAQAKGPPRPAGADPAGAFFKKGGVPLLHLVFAPEDAERLRAEPRQWSRCLVRENGRTDYAAVAVKLKGAAGSFREFDDRPAFTLRFDKGDEKKRRFHGLAKLHLNNSVQDETFLHEWLGSEVFRAAGLPAARVTHARVRIDDRDMGLYVLKEGFDREFLRVHVPGDADGTLYDGGFCQDIDADLERDEGKGPDDHALLHALREACQEPDLAIRRKLLEEKVAIDRFVTFMALELMLAHWDGYTQNRNNYRLYFSGRDGRAHFLPHGMDQLFGDSEASILDMPTSLLGAAVMKDPAWRTLYRRRAADLLPLFDAGRLGSLVDQVAKRLEPALAGDRDALRTFDERVSDLKRRLAARERSLAEQRRRPEPKPLVFARNTPLALTGWRAASEVEDASLKETTIAGERVLEIATGRSNRCIASFRKSVLLPRGRYRFTAQVRTEDVAPLDGDDPPGQGAGLRISGSPRDHHLLATNSFKPLTFDFEVEETARDVELVLELRATRGRVHFRQDSLRLTLRGK